MFFRKSNPYIDTWSGRHFHFMNPVVEEVSIEDIAHALSQTNRYTGHTDEPYSVAQHSYFVSLICDPKFALQGLMHDATEAYLNDVSKPVKILPQMFGYRRLEKKVSDCIMDAFFLPRQEHPSVKWADVVMLKLEFNQLFKKPRHGWWDDVPTTKWGLTVPDFSLNPWPAKAAEKIFLDRFDRLWSNR